MTELGGKFRLNDMYDFKLHAKRMFMWPEQPDYYNPILGIHYHTLEYNLFNF